MKIDVNQIKETDKVKTTSDIKRESDVDFKEFLGTVYQNGLPYGNVFNSELFDENLLGEFDINGIKSSYKYDVLSMDRDDAMFFANAVKGEQIAFNPNGEVYVNNSIAEINESSEVYKSATVSKTLINMLSDSMNKNKPIRIDFGNDISAVIKVDKQGRIAAEFIPSDKVAEEFLKNNISYLRETFAKEDIPYNDLSYRQQKKQNKKNGKGE